MFWKILFIFTIISINYFKSPKNILNLPLSHIPTTIIDKKTWKNIPQKMFFVTYNKNKKNKKTLGNRIREEKNS